MISLETTEDGFSVILNGRVALVHSQRAPLLEFGRGEASWHRHPGGPPPGERRRSKIKARGWKLVTAHERFIDIDFDGLARMGVRESEGAAHLSFSRYDASFNRFSIRLPAEADEAVFGCGQRRGELNLKGRRVTLWNGERAAETATSALGPNAEGEGTAHYGAPAFMTSARRYVRLATGGHCVFDFRKSRTMILSSWAVPEDVVVGFADDAAKAVGALSALAGRAPAVPRWMMGGACLGVQGGTAQALDKFERSISAGSRIGSVLLEDWCGFRVNARGRRCAWDWRWDEALYPRLPDEIAKLARRGIRTVAYINPCVDVDGRLYPEASKRGACLRRQDGSDYVIQARGSAFAMVDLFSPEAYAWIKDVIRKELLGIGVSAWIADFGDLLPGDAVLCGGLEPIAAHNGYADLWAKANAEAIAESGKEGEAAFFMRSSWIKATSLAHGFYPGASRVDWRPARGLPSVVRAALSHGFSGGGHWHPTIGGHAGSARTSRDRECLMRWTELAAFSPMMRSSEGLWPELNAQPWSDAASLAHFSRMSVIWADLAPYHQEVMEGYRLQGLPPLRHAWLHYEDEAWLHGYADQYLYGRDLLVAPVTLPRRELAKAALPADRWVHLWTSREFRGGEVTIEAPLGYPPVFYRADSEWAGLFEGLRRAARR